MLLTSKKSSSEQAAVWQSSGMACVAVYGSLRAGGVNDMVRWRANITPLGQTLLKGSLYDLGWYPGLRLQGEQLVLAEVYPIDAELEQALDGVEGLWPEDVGEYRKQILHQPVTSITGEVRSLDVLVYEATLHTVQGSPLITTRSGVAEPIDWLSWQAQRGWVHPDTAFALRTKT